MADHTRTIRGKPYRAVVLHVQESDRYGRPSRATLMYDEDSVQLKGGEEFIIVWAPVECVRKKAN